MQTAGSGLLPLIPWFAEQYQIVMDTCSSPRKSIRSYVVRGGRMTRGQQQAINELFPVYGLDMADNCPDKVDIPAVFGRHAQTVLEIGFGDGEVLVQLARENPDKNHIGVEVYRPGVGHFLLQLHKYQLENVRVLMGDAVDSLNDAFPDQSFDQINLFFPDPWPKKKHHKRRILQPGFVDCVIAKLKPGGVFHFATDWEDYASEALRKLECYPTLINKSGSGNYTSPPTGRPETKFERRGKQLGHGVWDVVMIRSGQVLP